jgi:undecaprenyl-diphosphatase
VGGSVDTTVMGAVVAHRTDWATAIARVVMWLGTTSVVLAASALVALVVVVRLRAYRPALAAVGSLALSGGAAVVLKHLVGRPRPSGDLTLLHVGGPSFPSTQASLTAALAVTLLVATTWPSPQWRRAAALVLLAGVVLVGACMVYLGAHWPTDVLAGWLLGAVVGAVVGRLVLVPRPNRGRRHARP